ncbi:MBL fold metallo-hydrolase [Amycolatopsis antarctica]|uniref:MBL fold metallo-hydrolase n=1 Tax=Amycolatopsis antarctica TaxID=1854586 RepID=A0A263D5K9_9PSEU|nr:MBL fold metallo-hydrolase [Amycolatopsis antarctica]OZM73792.1 MBL fold metallo-hydrolase [Amycolatopsis antarctica]
MTAEPPICAACGMQYGEPRETCPVCLDERQYVPAAGQRWTDLTAVRESQTARIEDEGPGITGIGSTPGFAIGQRALLVRTDAGNVLWDCTALLDDEIIARVAELGGLTGIAISHPHYYTTMVEWARVFDAPVYLHENDREWVGRPDPAIEFWSGREKSLGPDLTLHNLGVHFAGGTVLHWAGGEHGDGALLSGDIVQVIPDRTHVGFMYSYPNLIPERPQIVRQAAETLRPLAFQAIYGAWWSAVVRSDGNRVVQRSARRYLEYVR